MFVRECDLDQRRSWLTDQFRDRPLGAVADAGHTVQLARKLGRTLHVHRLRDRPMPPRAVTARRVSAPDAPDRIKQLAAVHRATYSKFKEHVAR